VRITDNEGKPVSSVYLGLSAGEAKELVDALSDLQSAQDGWHAHVNDATHEHEITVYREDDETAAFARSS
jgi:hypothetical protein